MDSILVKHVLLMFVVCCMCCHVGMSYTLQDLTDDIDFATQMLDSTSLENQDNKRSLKYEDLAGKSAILSTGDVPERFVCPRYPRPQHGQLMCGGRLCLVQCDDGYMQDRDHAFVYKCNPDGKWKTIPPNKPVPWPSCVEENMERLRESLLHMAGKKL